MELLIAQISPTAKVTMPSENIFDNPVIKECNYMFAQAMPYKMGANITEFNILLGNVKNLPNNVDILEVFQTMNITMTKDELATWGEHDESCYIAIASKLNLECMSFRTVKRTN